MAQGTMQTDTVLDRILRQTARDVEARRTMLSENALEERVRSSHREPLSLVNHLKGDNVGVIAEIKRGSPSRGVFSVDVNPPEVSAAYRNGGAAAISCLTDGPFFHGSLDDLDAVAATVHGEPRRIPVLRKDFTIDRYQLLEARAYGADAVLLIVAALDDGLLHTLHDGAREHGLSVLVEVHNEAEMERAMRLDPDIIGINNRDLHTFTVDLAVTERLAPMVSADACLVSESGIFAADDVARVAEAGADAVLVGESLILKVDREAAVRQLSAIARQVRA